MEHEVWIIAFRCRPLPECQIAIDDGGDLFNEAYVPLPYNPASGPALTEAIGHLRDMLLARHLQLIDISMCIRHEDENWPGTSEMDIKVGALARKAMMTGEVVLDIYRSSEIEAEVTRQFTVTGPTF